MKKNPDGTQQLTLDLIRGILVKELGINDDRVNIYNQKFKIPPDDQIFIEVGYKGSPKTISSRNIVKDVAGNFTEYQEIAMMEHIYVGMFSSGLDAIRRKEEMLMAINSVYAQQIQEANSFKIARLSAIDDLSALEGAAMLYRFEISLVVFACSFRKA